MASLMPPGKQQYFNPTTGRPLVGGQLFTYAAGTSTPKTTWQDAAGTIPNTNPITLDSTGSALVYWDGSYKIVLKDAMGNTIYTVDNYSTDPLGVKQFITSIATSIGASLIGFIQAAAGAIARTVQDKLRESVSVKDFGAVGDGVANDTDAFAAAAAYIQSCGGGTLIIPPGMYVVGKQTFAGATGKGYAYRAADIMKFTGCTAPITIEGNGAVLRIAPGLKFGSFNPVTGAANAPALPNTNADYAADVGYVIYATNNAAVTIRNLEIDGNSPNLTLGGQWGDTGYQRLAYGIYENVNASFRADNVYTHHHGTDGLSCGYTGAVDGGPSRPKTLVNVISEYNGRNNLSWVGGIGLTAINCKFNHACRAGFGSSPGAGIDIEAESAVIRNGVFINCVVGDNAGYAMVADSGDSADVTFYNCHFFGTTQGAIWPRKPRFNFQRCVIAGGAVNTYTAANEDDRTKYTDCLFSGDQVFEGTAAAAYPYLGDFTSQNPIFERCNFISSNPNVKLQASGSTATYRNCTMRQNGSTSQSLPRGTFEGINSITLSTGSADLGGCVNYGKLTVSGTVAGIGVSQTGEIGNVGTPATLALMGFGSNGGIWLASKVAWLYQAPTSGTWTRGDKIINNNPAVGQPKGWMCTVSGTPGTWVSEGNL